MASASGQEYDDLIERMTKRFAQIKDCHLFTTDVDPERLWSAYLLSFPASERQFHNCNTCRRFIQRFGALVTIDADGVSRPAVFQVVDLSGDFAGTYTLGIAAMLRLVRGARVTGVFYCSDTVWGIPSNMGKDGKWWTHYHVKPHRSMVYTAPGAMRLDAGQAMAKQRENFKNMMTALNEFDKPLVDRAVALLQVNQAYRADVVMGPAKFLQTLQNFRTSPQVRNLCWRAIAAAPDGFLHPKSSMIGTVLEDLASGMSDADVLRRFEAKMAPSVYQRPTAAPTVNAVEQAEKLVAKLGIAKSLERRFARLDELSYGRNPEDLPHVLWTARPAKAPGASGVFGQVKTKDGERVMTTRSTEAQKITWEKFARTVLPDADAVEVLAPTTDTRFAALVTAVDPASPPILRWDSEDPGVNRNTFSWFYAAGVDAEIRRRLVKAGAKFEDCDIRASLIWHDRNDLDLHCLTPSGEHIYFGHKRSACGGWLDVDMNVCGETREPVENIRWEKGRAPNGRYQFWVDNFAYHEFPQGFGGRPPTPFTVELEVNGEVFTYQGHVTVVRQLIQVAEFFYGAGLPVRLGRTPDLTKGGQAPAGLLWGLQPNTFVKVTGIVPSPNRWGVGDDAPIHAQGGRHMFFLLDGCKPADASVGRGFYPEMLRSELRDIRSTLEAYTASQQVQGLEDASACGLGFSDQADWNLRVRVTISGGAVAEYVIDRWD